MLNPFTITQLAIQQCRYKRVALDYELKQPLSQHCMDSSNLKWSLITIVDSSIRQRHTGDLNKVKVSIAKTQ